MGQQSGLETESIILGRSKSEHSNVMSVWHVHISMPVFMHVCRYISIVYYYFTVVLMVVENVQCSTILTYNCKVIISPIFS